MTGCIISYAEMSCIHFETAVVVMSLSILVVDVQVFVTRCIVATRAPAAY